MREKITIPDKVEITKRKMPKEKPGDFLPFKADENGTSPMVPFGEGYNIPVTGLTHDERGYPDASSPEAHAKIVKRLCNKILNNKEDIVSVEEEFCDDADIILISYGAPFRSVSAAVEKGRSEGIKIGSLKINTPWPFPDSHVLKASENAKNLVVVEMNLGQMVNEVKRVANGNANIHLIGKIGGELHRPEEILSKVREL
jgi:2-oxoglutarate ferredoxin oxidoreductase subunit alpha